MTTRPLTPEEWISYIAASLISWSILILIGVGVYRLIGVGVYRLIGVGVYRVQGLPMALRIAIWVYLLIGGAVGTSVLHGSALEAMQREQFIFDILYGIQRGVAVFLFFALLWPDFIYWSTSRW